MPNNAKCSIIGNLARDAEQGTWKESSYASFVVVVNTTKKEGDKYIPDYYKVTLWGKAAEYAFPKLKKGTKVWANGDLVLQHYKGKDGVEHSSLSLRANDVLTFPAKGEESSNLEEPPF